MRQAVLSQSQVTQTFSIPDGAAGTRATLRLMARLVRQYRSDPLILSVARDLASMSASGDYRSEVESLFYFVRDQIRYIQDTNGTELIHAPDEMLAVRAGDCDDKSTLLATLLESIGHPARLVATGYGNPGEFEHVFVETKIGRDWLGLETTPIDGMKADIGWIPVPPYIQAPVTSYMVEWI